MSSAADILSQAASEMKDRAETYDKPDGERSMAATVTAFNAITGHDLTEQQGWQFMETLKMVRSNQGAFHPDCFVDGAAYAALAGEAAAREAGKADDAVVVRDEAYHEFMQSFRVTDQ